MIVFLLLVIIVIMLFGARAVRGLLGSILTYVALVSAFSAIVILGSKLTLWTWAIIAVVLAGAVGGLYWIDGWRELNAKRELAEFHWKTFSGLISAELTDAERRGIERKLSIGDADGLLKMCDQISKAQIKRRNRSTSLGATKPSNVRAVGT